MEPFPVVRMGHIPREAAPEKAWLIDSLWAREAIGCIGGTPKSYKTWLALEMAIAVASGQPCLGRFPVRNPGTVLIYAAEDSPVNLRERCEGIAQARRVQLSRVALGLITEPALRLDCAEHRDRLTLTLQQLRPKLLILDPLVRLHRGDENSSSEISQLLGFLRQLQREFEVAIVLVHHTRKSGAGQPGQALRGSGDLHAFGDSNLYLLRQKGALRLIVEHRSHPVPEPLEVQLAQDPVHLTVREIGEEVNKESLSESILKILSLLPLNRTQLRERIGVRNETLGEELKRLQHEGRIVRQNGAWSVPACDP